MELFRIRIGVLSLCADTATRLIARLPRSVDPIHITTWDHVMGPLGRQLDAVLHCISPQGSSPCPLPLTVPVHSVGPEELDRTPGEWESLIYLNLGHKPVYHPLNRMLGRSKPILQVKQHLLKVSNCLHPVVLSGENGTGKDLAATLVHELSPRQSGPLVAVNCSAIPLTLAESMLFGSVKGAYTDAETREGVCQQARGGTLFLDEIGELSLEVQAKLLRVLESGDLRKVGGLKNETSDFRLVCATNQHLPDAVREGRFRQDLYYRINVLGIRMPALRERPDDIIDLIQHFGCRPLTPEGLLKLQGHQWPGNLRQLRNVLLRAQLIHDVEALGPEHLDFEDACLG